MPWREELKNNIQNLYDLEQLVRIPRNERRKLKKVMERHPMSLTRYYASLIDWRDPDDPLRKIAVPSIDELNLSGSYDPSREKQYTRMPGLQHKYRQTALILTTNRCSLYCRHCFRKRLVGLPTEEIISQFEEAAEYIDEHQEITNVLLSGGDPMVLPTRVLKMFLSRLSKIAHLDYIRIGTRIPVSFPYRILDDEGLIRLLKEYTIQEKRIYITTQFDHPREITEHSTAAVRCLTDAGLVVSNQTVLLRGVNDDARTIVDLQRDLVRIGVVPYYMFQCRPVKRVKQIFQVPLMQGFRIIQRAKSELDGYSKRFSYVMSHRTGKIEIVGIKDDEIFFRYHQAKEPRNTGRFFKRKLDKKAAWLTDLPAHYSLPHENHP